MNGFRLVPVLCVLLLVAPVARPVLAAGTIAEGDRYAYGANIGWQDWRADGVTIGAYVCSGHIYAANVGWIHLGDGRPSDGIGYGNNSATDYGVNHLGDGRLRGMAYGANIGWVTFEEQGDPRVNLLTGELSGYIYGANVGWIRLNTAHAAVRTETMAPGTDTDGDGIPDAWEIIHYGGKTHADASAIVSNGVNNAWEAYMAGLDPRDPGSSLRIRSVAYNGKYAKVEWESVPSRVYRLEYTDTLTGDVNWTDSALGAIAPDAGATTARSILRIGVERECYRIRAVRPLQP